MSSYHELDSQIKFYCDRLYNPLTTAQNFFASSSENEVARKLNEMSKTKLNVESVLREKVRDNYMLFLQANMQIGRVGIDMADLQDLVDNTQELILEVQNSTIISKAAYHNLANTSTTSGDSHELDLKSYRTVENIDQGNNKMTSSSTFEQFKSSNNVNIHTWLINVSNKLSRLIIEQKYGQAVQVIIKVRKYYENLNENNNHDKNIDFIYKNVEKICIDLSKILSTSLSELPHSTLWGEEEFRYRLKLLIVLGKYKLAAEGFSKSQFDVIKKVLNKVETSGDSVIYTTDLTQSFFNTMTNAGSSFLNLFKEINDNSHHVDIISLILNWSHEQVAAYVIVFSKQVQVGSNEKAIILLNQIKQNQSLSVVVNNNDISTSNMVKKYNILQSLKPFEVSNGPFLFITRCIEIAFQSASKLDIIGLQGTAALGWLIFPEIQKLIIVYTNDLIKELSFQVKSKKKYFITILI